MPVVYSFQRLLEHDLCMKPMQKETLQGYVWINKKPATFLPALLLSSGVDTKLVIARNILNHLSEVKKCTDKLHAKMLAQT